MVERSGDKKSEVSTCESRAGCVDAGTEQVFWCTEKKSGSILRSQTPLSYPSQNKIAQSDVTAETALKSALLKMLRISKLDHSNGAFPYLIIEKND
jgi:hypothetical protein